MKCRIHIQVETADKALMVQRLNARRQSPPNPISHSHNATTTIITPAENNSKPAITSFESSTSTSSNPHPFIESTPLQYDSISDAMPEYQPLVPDPKDGWITLESGKKYGSAKKVFPMTNGRGEGGQGEMEGRMIDPKGTWKDGEGILYI